MIDKAHDLPVVRQVQLLELSRSSVYYQPQPTSEIDLMLMRRIDELHLEHRGGSANPDIELSEISASMGDGNRLPRSRSNEKTPP